MSGARSAAARRSGWRGTGWTSVDDVRATLRKRWSSGALLRDHLSGNEFEPIQVALRGPASKDLAEQLIEAKDWARHFDTGSTHYSLVWHTVGGRYVGSNELPRRLVISSRQDLFAFLGVRSEVQRVEGMLRDGETLDPAIGDWVRARPTVALSVVDLWPRLLACVQWIRDHTATGAQPRYLRELDIHGVDTKFIEANHKILAPLVDAVLPAESINVSYPSREFAARYGFATRPAFVRSRMLDGTCWVTEGVSDCYIRVDEAARRAPLAREVLIVENEISYLALPPLPGVLGVFGKGYDVARLADLPWLRDLPVRYWGDLDTHGFLILDRLRAHVPHAHSVLMDIGTLLAHRDLCGTEPNPARGNPSRLTGPELTALDYLIDNAVDGQPLRLEQERISFDTVCAALETPGCG